MSRNNELFKVISDSFGLSGKTIEIFNKRNTDKGIRISDINYTKDGLTILKSYCDAHGNDVIAYRILEEVIKYESRYGDGTSLLTMLLVYLTKVHKEVPFTEEELDIDIDYILDLIESEKVTENIDNDSYVKNWIKTVCKNDPISDTMFDFYKKNSTAIIKSVKKIDKPGIDEVSFRSVQGYCMYSHVYKLYTEAHLRYLRDVHIRLVNGTITASIFNDALEYGYSKGKKVVVIGTEIDKEVDEIIGETSIHSHHAFAIKLPTDKGLEYIKDDLSFLLNGEYIIKEKMEKNGSITRENTGIIGANVKEIKFTDSYVYFFGFNRTSEEMYHYADAIDKNFVSADQTDKANHELRKSNIRSNDNFEILINSKTVRRERVLRGMIEDVCKSKPHYPHGVITGGMEYIKQAPTERLSIIVKIVKDIRKLLLKGSVEEHKSFHAVDLYANTVEIYEVVRNFMRELINTSENNIEVELKWFG